MKIGNMQEKKRKIQYLMRNGSEEIVGADAKFAAVRYNARHVDEQGEWEQKTRTKPTGNLIKMMEKR